MAAGERKVRNQNWHALAEGVKYPAGVGREPNDGEEVRRNGTLPSVVEVTTKQGDEGKQRRWKTTRKPVGKAKSWADT